VLVVDVLINKLLATKAFFANVAIKFLATDLFAVVNAVLHLQF
jgi:hypothetical protein